MITWRFADVNKLPEESGIYKGIKVDQLDINGNYIKTYDNMRIAAESNGSIQNRSAINRVCRGQKKTAYGSKWRYYND